MKRPKVFERSEKSLLTESRDAVEKIVKEITDEDLYTEIKRGLWCILMKRYNAGRAGSLYNLCYDMCSYEQEKRFYKIFLQVLLDYVPSPRFAPEEFQREMAHTMAYLQTSGGLNRQEALLVVESSLENLNFSGAIHSLMKIFCYIDRFYLPNWDGRRIYQEITIGSVTLKKPLWGDNLVKFIMNEKDKIKNNA